MQNAATKVFVVLGSIFCFMNNYYYKLDSRDCENVSDWSVVQYCPERSGRNVRYKPAANDINQLSAITITKAIAIPL